MHPSREVWRSLTMDNLSSRPGDCRRYLLKKPKSKTTMRIVLFILLLSSLSIVLPLLAEINSQQKNGVTAAESGTFPFVEHDGIVVTLIEESISRSPDVNQIVTSFLFNVENRNEMLGQHSIKVPFRFFSSDSELYQDASNGLPKTSGVSYEYNRQRLPEFDGLPNPVDESKTFLYRYRIHDELPRSVSAAEAGFGQNGEIRRYRFPLHRI